jgi:predicted nuclease of predicted toxin-antitoxin system
VRFKLDENIDVRAATVLAEAGHDVATVASQGLGGAVDAVVAEAVLSEDRILVTLDRGFGGAPTLPVRIPASSCCACAARPEPV